MPWGLFQYLPEKMHFSALGTDYFVSWLSADSTTPMWTNFLPEPSILPISHTHSLTIICIWVFFKKAWWSFHLQLISQPSFCCALWRPGQSFWGLGLAQHDKLFAVNIDPAYRKEKEMLSPSRRWTQCFDWFGIESSDGHAALGLLWSCPDGQCCNYPNFPAAVSSLLKAGLDCLRSRIQFAVPPVTCCDSFGDKSGLNWIQVSLLWDRREV